jgi:hypothetical protein
MARAKTALDLMAAHMMIGRNAEWTDEEVEAGGAVHAAFK